MPKFQVGQQVKYVNGNGVYIGVRTITATTDLFESGGETKYYITPTDSPWFAHREDSFTALDEPLPDRKFRVTFWTLSDSQKSVEVMAGHAEQAVNKVMDNDDNLFAQFKSVELIA